MRVQRALVAESDRDLQSKLRRTTASLAAAAMQSLMDELVCVLRQIAKLLGDAELVPPEVCADVSIDTYSNMTRVYGNQKQNRNPNHPSDIRKRCSCYPSLFPPAGTNGRRAMAEACTRWALNGFELMLYW